MSTGVQRQQRRDRIGRWIMDDKLKIWTTVGSAGILNQADLAKVTLHGSIIQIGVNIVLPQADAARPLGQLGAFPTIQAVARYNVTPVDGLFFEHVPSAPFFYGLQLRYLGHVTAKLMEVDLDTGSETERVVFDSTKFSASPFFQVNKTVEASPKGVFDFVKKAYYVEATLVAPALVVGHPAAISIIKVVAEQQEF
jgi:hypothetical protein